MHLNLNDCELFRNKKAGSAPAGFLLIAFIFCAGVAVSQDKKTTEPQYNDQFFALGETGTLTLLERQTPKWSGRKQILTVSGERSPVRLTQSNSMTFIVRVGSRNIDPAAVIQFASVKSHGNQRELKMVVAYPSQRATIPPESAIQFEATRYGDSSFAIKWKDALPPGEYTLGLNTNEDGYMFGVDENPGFVSSAVPLNRSVSEPEYDNKYYAVTGDTLLPLEHETLSRGFHVAPRPFGVKQTQTLVANGPTSPVQLPPTAHFVVRLSSDRIDPQTAIRLRPFSAKQKNRELLLNSETAIAIVGGRAKNPDDNSVSVTTKLYRSPPSVEIVPSSPLAAGEYCFLNGDTDGYCFSISGK